MRLAQNKFIYPVTPDMAPLPPESVIFGKSSIMQGIRRNIESLKGSNVPVLIQGESGTGKEVLASYVHNRAPWGDGPLVKVNCPSIPDTLLESELFGFEKGAFTGAHDFKPGRVELADKGTLFFDEISELGLGIQAKLLQVVQDGKFTRIGGRRDKQVRVRVLCATNRNLENEVEAGSFRQDLFYRINVVAMHLPALHDRREDIPALVNYFLLLHGGAGGNGSRMFTERALRILCSYHWPGNIRQLENTIRRFVILGNEQAIIDSLAEDTPGAGALPGLNGKSLSLKRLTRQAVQELEKKLIVQALEAHQWNRKDAARALKISYRAMLYKMRQAGLPFRNGHKQIT